jgi:hypothetical protein
MCVYLNAMNPTSTIVALVLQLIPPSTSTAVSVGTNG